jgi:hypothetical protein
MDDIKSNIKVWLDECLLHTKTEDDLLATLNFFFKKCQEHELKLHAIKCVLFATTVRYCGRLITKDGVRIDPKNMEALQTMHEPQNGVDLVQYVAAVNWMRSAIPNYSERLGPLQVALAKVLEGKSRRTKKICKTCSRLRRRVRYTQIDSHAILAGPWHRKDERGTRPLCSSVLVHQPST